MTLVYDVSVVAFSPRTGPPKNELVTPNATQVRIYGFQFAKNDDNDDDKTSDKNHTMGSLPTSPRAYFFLFFRALFRLMMMVVVVVVGRRTTDRPTDRGVFVYLLSLRWQRAAAAAALNKLLYILYRCLNQTSWGFLQQKDEQINKEICFFFCEKHGLLHKKHDNSLINHFFEILIQAVLQIIMFWLINVHPFPEKQ